MSEHPFKGPYDDRDAAALLAAMKLNTRLQLADADEVNNTKLAGQFGGIYVRSTQANYRLDTEDTQDDDGENILHSSDGVHFVKTAESIAPVRAEYDDADISAGAISFANGVDIVVVTITGATNLVIPPAADRGGKTIMIKKNGAGTLTPDLDGSETIDGNSPSGYAIATDGGYLHLVPATGGYDVLAMQL